MKIDGKVRMKQELDACFYIFIQSLQSWSKKKTLHFGETNDLYEFWLSVVGNKSHFCLLHNSSHGTNIMYFFSFFTLFGQNQLQLPTEFIISCSNEAVILAK